jgi:tetratricopeptide (TPR) repeat protein
MNTAVGPSPDAYVTPGDQQDLLPFEEALGAHDRTLALRPDFADAHSDHGNAPGPGAVRRSAGELYRAIKLEPGFAEAYFNRGNALKELNRFENGELRPHDDPECRLCRSAF